MGGSREPRAPGDVLVHLRRARDHADRHYAEPVDLDTMASVAGLSRYHFLRLFRATYGRHAGGLRVAAQDRTGPGPAAGHEPHRHRGVPRASGSPAWGRSAPGSARSWGSRPTDFQRRYAAGAPHIPGCFVFMWGLAETRRPEASQGPQSGRSTGAGDAPTLEP